MVFVEALVLVITTILDTIILFSIPLVLIWIVGYILMEKM